MKKNLKYFVYIILIISIFFGVKKFSFPFFDAAQVNDNNIYTSIPIEAQTEAYTTCIDDIISDTSVELFDHYFQTGDYKDGAVELWFASDNKREVLDFFEEQGLDTKKLSLFLSDQPSTGRVVWGILTVPIGEEKDWLCYFRTHKDMQSTVSSVFFAKEGVVQ